MKIEEIKNQNLSLSDEEISRLKSAYRRSITLGLRELDDEEMPEVTFNSFNPHDFRDSIHFFSVIIRSCDSEELLKVILKACFKQIEVLENAYEQEDSLLMRDQISKVLSFFYSQLGFLLLKGAKKEDYDYECGYSFLPYSKIAERCNLSSNNKEAEKYLCKAFMYSPHNVELQYNLGCFYLFNCKKEEHCLLVKASKYFLSTREAYKDLKNSLFLPIFINHELINYCGALLYDNKYYEEAFKMFMYAYELDKAKNHRFKDRDFYCYNLALYYLDCSKKSDIDSLKNKYKRKGIRYIKELERIVQSKGMTFKEFINDPQNDPDGIIKEYIKINQ